MNRQQIVESRAQQPRRSTLRTILSLLCLILVVLVLLGFIVAGVVTTIDAMRGHPGETMSHVGLWFTTVVVPIMQGIVVLALFPTGYAVWRKLRTHQLEDKEKLAKITALASTTKLAEYAIERGYNAKMTVDGVTTEVISPDSIRPASRVATNSYEIEQKQQEEVKQLVPPRKSGRELIEDGTVQAALSQGKIILGYDEQNILKMMKVVNFFSCILGGIPNSGKSSTAFWILVQLIWAGVHIILVDPHMHYQSEDGNKGLAQELEPFRFAYLPQFPPCDMENPAVVLARVKWMKNDLLRRKKPGYVVRASEILIIVFDEFNSVIEIEEISKELADDLAYIEREGRKYGVHVMLLGHRWAQQDIGNIKIRTCASNILAHRFNDETQGKILLGQSDGKRVLELDPGYYWLRSIMAGVLAKIYTPYLAAPDVPLVLEAMRGGMAAFPAQVVDADPSGVQSKVESGTGSSRPKMQSTIPSNNQAESDAVQADDKPVDRTFPFDPLKLEKVHRLVVQKRNQNEIICEVWEVQENTRAFRAAREEFRDMLAYIASMTGRRE